MSTAPESPTEFTYVDAGGVEIFATEWKTAEPIGVVQISHGIGEHSKRYADFAQHLTRAGFAVFADDHRGHGETGRRQHDGDLSRLGRLGPGGLAATEAAILQLTDIARERYPGLPVIMFAHSWGSLMAQRSLNQHPHRWDALVLSGSAFRSPRFMESGDLNAKWAGPDANGFEWLSRDPAVSAEFIADPLCFGADILKLFGLADGLKLFGKPATGLPQDLPILIVSGAADPLNRGDGLQRLGEAYRRRGVRDVSVKLYPDARHELLNETNREEVIADIITWMLERVAPE
ncbi:alpha/beta fold hydrolase [Leucobacter luti]|uniref:Alpha-beta hydrolase superfamily lysophospholipase n=1 Tax=Leucobacter luti TaxID=340320 RepID=A0A4Q7U3W5_9MICO|nr:alpha/beta hydrolase [Leucobacter luti]MBL3699352.1 alpha/beta hydrolase [Leucobacter luti]RZT66862.1 alpha-beta hydrolase superfamily lysophospholipase [Leucobacter luti]